VTANLFFETTSASRLDLRGAELGKFMNSHDCRYFNAHSAFHMICAVLPKTLSSTIAADMACGDCQRANQSRKFESIRTRPRTCTICRISAFLVCLLIYLARPIHAVDMQPDEFRKVYSEALDMLELKYRNCHTVGTQVRPGFTATVEHLVLDGALQTWTHYPDDRATIRELANHPALYVRSKSDDIMFKVGRNTAESEFYIVGLGDSLRGDVERSQGILSAPMSLAATHIPFYSMREFIADPNVKVVKVQEIALAERLMQADFDLSARREYLQKGSIWFRPDSGWVIDHYELASKEGDAGTEFYYGRVEYDEFETGTILFPRSVDIEFANRNEARHMFAKWSLANVKFNTVDKTMFTLEHFGLGNRDLIAAQNQPLPWLAIVSALVLLVSAGYLTMRRKKG